MINHNFDEFTPIFVQTLMTSLLLFSLLGFGTHQLKKISMQPTYILCLNHVSLENRFNKKFVTCLSINLTNSFQKL